MLYLNLCVTCQKKGNTTKKDLAVRPFLSSEINSRCQIADRFDRHASTAR